MSIETTTTLIVNDFITKGGETSPWSLHIYALGGKAVVSLVWNDNVTAPANQTILDLVEFKQKVAAL